MEMQNCAYFTHGILLDQLLEQIFSVHEASVLVLGL